MAKNKCATCNRFDPSDTNFQTILICTVRYSIGRRTYMPELVTRYIETLLPQMTDNTLAVMQRDVEKPETSAFGSYGDECDRHRNGERAMAQDVEESKKLEMYVKYHSEKPVRYAYGEPWVAMAMYMDDYGFPTPEEAIEAWNRRNGDG